MNNAPQLCLSIRQPWAWLIVNGYKDIENRTWPTKVRGPILIHAIKTMTPTDWGACVSWLSMYGWGRALAEKMPKRDEYAMGGIVGEAVIEDCVTEHASRWFEGPHGFLLSNQRPLPFVPCKGALGFFKHIAPSASERSESSGVPA